MKSALRLNRQPRHQLAKLGLLTLKTGRRPRARSRRERRGDL
jgi:hypothetical protein